MRLPIGSTIVLVGVCLGLVAGCSESSPDSSGGAAGAAGSGGAAGAAGAAGAGGAAAQGGSAGAADQDAGPDAPADIFGSMDLAVQATSCAWSSNITPQPGAAVRVENAAGGYLEGITGDDGIAHILVDSAQGPFAVTVAKKDFAALSIVGVTAPVGHVCLYPATLPDFSARKSVTGQIAGTQPSGTRLIVDSLRFMYVGPLVPAGATSYQAYYLPSVTAVPLRPSVVEFDPAAALLVNGAMADAIPNPTGDLTVDLQLPDPPLVPKKATMTVNFATSGLAAAPTINGVMDGVGAGGALLCTVVKLPEPLQTVGQGVGVGSVVRSVDETSLTVEAQYFDGDLQPDLVLAQLEHVPAPVMLHLPLDDGAVYDLPAVESAELVGTSPDDLRYGAVAPGMGAVELTLTQNPGGYPIIKWLLVDISGDWPQRGLPHLPSAVAPSDFLTDGSIVDVNLAMVKPTGPFDPSRVIDMVPELTVGVKHLSVLP